MKKIIIPVMVFALSGCVDVDIADLQAANAAAVKTGVALEIGARHSDTMHFSVSAYTNQKADYYSTLAEKYYEKLMTETGLYSFAPKTQYEILVCGDQQEYITKTKQPAWSGGVTVGNAIVVYESTGADAVIAHEMTHLVFNEFMGKSMPELRWLNEGLATRMEFRSYTSAQLLSGKRASFEAVKAAPMPFSKMANFAPLNSKPEEAANWYLQVESVVEFMLDKESAMGFSSFLGKLKNGVSVDEALNWVYPGKWDSMAELEKSWLAYISANGK